MKALGPPEILREVRLRLDLGTDAVERWLKLPESYLSRIEDGSEPLDTALLDTLAEFYGVDAALVASGTPVADALEPVRVLLKSSSPDLTPTLRSDVAQIAMARRTVKALEAELGEPDRYATLRRLFKHEGVYGHHGAEWEAGELLARRLREHLDLHDRTAITSVRDLISRLGIELVAATIHDRRVAGFSLADKAHGPCIVINLSGPNANPWVRRFTLAHELCHVLHDELEHNAIAPIQLYADAAGEMPPITGAEPRANSFAANLLAPASGVKRFIDGIPPSTSLEERIRMLMCHFGINFQTATYRLRHVCRVPDALLKRIRAVDTLPAPGDDWYASEAFWDDEFFPCQTIPLHRRGSLLRLVLKAWTEKRVDRRQALELLHAAPDEKLEDLLSLP